jgi:hypothetical protein
VVASLDNDSKDGSQPEVVTFNKELFLREYPRGLGYFYDYKINDAGDTVRHYPAGVAVYTVLLPEPERPDPAGNDLDNINGSGARVEVFQGNTRVAAYDVTEIGLPEALRTWTVLLVEVGFKNPNPRTGDDVYFRVLPFSGLDETIRAGIFAWEDRRAADAYQPGPDGRPVPAPIREIHAGVDVTGRLVLSGRTDDPASPYGLWVLRQDPGQPAGFVRVLPDTAPITALSYDSGRVLGARNGLVYEIGGPMRDDGTPLGADCEEEVTLLYSTSVGLSRTVFAGTVGGLRRFDEVRLRCPLVGQSARGPACPGSGSATGSSTASRAATRAPATATPAPARRVSSGACRASACRGAGSATSKRTARTARTRRAATPRAARASSAAGNAAGTARSAMGTSIVPTPSTRPAAPPSASA